MNSTITIGIIGIVFALYTAFWRYWFGGGYPQWFKDHIKPSIRRFIMNALNITMMFLACVFIRDTSWISAVIISCIMQFLYWNYTFGMYMDIGRTPDYSPESIEEYKKSWFNSVLDWMFKPDERYGRLYDFTGMVIRFTFPCLILMFFNTFTLGFCLLGLLIPYCYEIGEIIYDKKLENRHWILASFAEFFSGFVTGLMFIWNGLFLNF